MRGKLRVLVVEDSSEVCQFVVEYILKPRGYEVDTAGDGAEGLFKALTDVPDLILLDFELPKLNGLELLRELRKSEYQTPVIMMTSFGSEEVAVEGFRLGVRDYIIKPFTTTEMVNAIENVFLVTRLQQDKEALTQEVMQINRQLERRVQELNTLAQIGKTITALMSPDKMLDRIVDAVLYMTRSEECTLTLVNPHTGQLRAPISKKQRLPQTSPLTSTLPATSDLRLVPKTNLAAPLKLGQRTVGHLRISKPPTGRITADDERVLGLLADYAAIAIHNMQLVSQLHLVKEQEKQQIRGLFERYVAPRVVEHMLTQPAEVSLGGTRQTVAVLFADIRGFSAFSAQSTPETLVKLLNLYLSTAAEAVLAEEGTLDKFMGDAVMAFFNAPLPQPDYLLRAVRAAWQLCRRVEQLHGQLLPQHQLKFRVGVGLGEVIVGNIGTPQLMNFTIIGDAVNKAKRLQENAQAGQILIAQETYELIKPHIQAHYVAELHLKGQNLPEPVYEVIGLLT
ncbi:MAG: adenylate/guanylate cyclase domain-containing protein [Anaerolineae bacterium]